MTRQLTDHNNDYRSIKSLVDTFNAMKKCKRPFSSVKTCASIQDDKSKQHFNSDL